MFWSLSVNCKHVLISLIAFSSLAFVYECAFGLNTVSTVTCLPAPRHDPVLDPSVGIHPFFYFQNLGVEFGVCGVMRFLWQSVVVPVLSSTNTVPCKYVTMDTAGVGPSWVSECFVPRRPVCDTVLFRPARRRSFVHSLRISYFGLQSRRISGLSPFSDGHDADDS